MQAAAAMGAGDLEITFLRALANRLSEVKNKSQSNKYAA